MGPLEYINLPQQILESRLIYLWMKLSRGVSVYSIGVHEDGEFQIS